MSQAGIVNVGGSTPGVVETLTGNSGGAVGPNGAHNINVVGTGNVTVTGNAGTNTLTISVVGEGEVWQTITASQTLAVNNGYVCVSPGGALALALPAVSAVGAIIEVTLDGATSFSITQSAGQQIRIGNTATTAGAGGSLTSTQQGDSIRMVCSVANLKWNVLSSMGNPTVV
jgi:hypothetical protein